MYLTVGVHHFSDQRKECPTSPRQKLFISPHSTKSELLLELIKLKTRIIEQFGSVSGKGM